MRPLRLLILLLVLALVLLAALIRPLDGLAGDAAVVTKNAVRKHAQRSSTQRTRRRRHTKHYMHPRNIRIVGYARKFIGTPYVWGGSTPHPGFDCSGFVRYVYQHFGISLPHSSYGDMSRGRYVLRKYLKPGDLVFFNGGGHVGIYVGSNRLIDALHSGTTVRISRMSDWYSYSYDGARRLVASN